MRQLVAGWEIQEIPRKKACPNILVACSKRFSVVALMYRPLFLSSHWLDCLTLRLELDACEAEIAFVSQALFR